jgi:LmbE family N-acetylglucosaminyl deacetylase
MMKAFFLMSMLGGVLMAQDRTLRVIAFGAHPDDCDIRAAGTAMKFAAMGHKVKFVSVTNGDAGHQSEGGGALAKRRRAEAQESARRSGIAEYEVLDNHDGELLPTLPVREQIIRAIRTWNADLVLAPRPNDYHPDHRYTGVLIQDAAYMVVVPNICPDTPPLRNNPAFFYYEDHFQKPAPFRPDVAIAIDDVWEKKVDVLDSHVSQFYEWLPWVDHTLESVPKDPADRKQWLSRTRSPKVSAAVRQSLEKWYGVERGRQVKAAESFELCEYGYQPKEEELKKLFPMLGK